MGDFNHHIDWIQQGERRRDSIFLDFVNDKFLFQHVEESTRGNKIPYINDIDLIISSEDNVVNDLRIGEYFCKSDHIIIRFNRSIWLCEGRLQQ